jgi:mono/diheme cytochrome c family protein
MKNSRWRIAPALMLIALAAPSLLWARKPWIDKVPSNERERTNALFGTADSRAAGQQLFEAHCAECHGADARGKGHHPSLRSERVQEQATPGDLHWLLVNGVLGRGMPSWRKLPDPQLWQIISFVKSLKESTAENASLK